MSQQEGKVYWTSIGVDKIQRANLDGSNVEDLVSGGTNPRFITVDSAAGKMYWSDEVGSRVQRANVDGSDVENLVTELKSPRGVALDLAAGKLYFTDYGVNVVDRVNLDGGAIALGHPVGATGVKQVYELFRQLNGLCGDYQLASSPTRGLCANMGGDDRTSVVTLLEKK